MDFEVEANARGAIWFTQPAAVALICAAVGLGAGVAVVTGTGAIAMSGQVAPSAFALLVCPFGLFIGMMVLGVVLYAVTGETKQKPPK